MGQLGILYHTQNGSYVQPVEGGADYVVAYTDGQLYGLCDDDQIATPAQLAVRGLAFLPVAGGFNPTTQRWNTATKAVEAIPAKPIAKIITKDALGAPQTLFTVAQTITVRAEIWKPDLSGVLTTFAGTYPVPFFDSNGREHYLKMVFANGVSELTIAAGKLQPSKYRATKASSTLADVVPHEIIVALNGA